MAAHVRLAKLGVRAAERLGYMFALDDRTRAVVREELDPAKTLCSVMRRDARIGFEEANHHGYTANDLIEKAHNCEASLGESRSGRTNGESI